MRLWLLLLPSFLLLLGCAAEPRPSATPVASVARACQHVISEQLQLAGAILTTNRCAD